MFSLDLAQTAAGGYVPGQISALAAVEYAAYAAGLANPVFQGAFEPVPLLDARNAGVPGVVVAWTGLPGEEVVNQYNPFTTSYPAASGLPAAGDSGYPVATVRPGTIPAYFGEGSSLYAAGLGTVSLCPLPTYLLQAGDAQQPQLPDLDKLGQRLMYGQILALAQTIGTLDALPASAPQAGTPGPDTPPQAARRSRRSSGCLLHGQLEPASAMRNPLPPGIMRPE